MLFLASRKFQVNDIVNIKQGGVQTACDMTMMRARSAPIHALAFICMLYISTKKGTAKYLEPKVSSVTSKNILDTHNKSETASGRKYPLLEIFGFVTPWNANGKTISLSEAERGRLNVVSPVSWQMHPDGLNGGDDFEEDYYQSMSEQGTRVYPRILFEKWNSTEFVMLSDEPAPMVARIIELCKQYNFEGVVIEIFQELLSTGTLSRHKEKALGLVRTLGEGIRKEGFKTVLVLLPYSTDVPQHGISCSTLKEISRGYSYIITMTYDYSTPGSAPGPIAPLSWVRQVAIYLSLGCELGGKVLIGLNFYGIDFWEGGQSRHIVGHEFLKLLEEHEPDMLWWDEFGEHGFAYQKKGEHVVFYPTRESIRLRTELADEIGCGGVAIWDLGQGLEHFFEEF
ncbi:Chitinase domain-containing protein 1 [Gracilariopsis chorda]|uniref:Chitinase domain-containing protein 1 n=1 Tax=Gracilariopsis chorda TaxID=448386 RepID=A0A2V3ILA2_9FLOR|nr:Chitinase domain-containing protein 1 [Gracilariopsis chorda]|eukprot:PXF42839.1 Chitinase domain-containing protein 1 [Gracilariopsis chorda]